MGDLVSVSVVIGNTRGYPQVRQPTGGYPTAYPGTPPPYTTGGYQYPTAAGQPVPSGGLGRGIVLTLAAAVVVVGLLGTAALILFLRPRSAEAPERPPVTLRSPPYADAGAVTTVPVAPTTTLAAIVPVAPAALPSAAPTVRPTPPPRRASTPTATIPTEVAEEVPPPEPARPAVAEPPRAVSPAFNGAGKVDIGAKFYEKTLTFEVGVHNLALALTVIYTMLKRPDLAATVLLYAVVMPATALAFVAFAKRLIAEEERRTVAARRVA